VAWLRGVVIGLTTSKSAAFTSVSVHPAPLRAAPDAFASAPTALPLGPS